MSAAKKPAAKKAAEKDDVVNEPTEKQVDKLEEQAFGEEVGASGTASLVVPERDERADKALLEKREELGSIPGARTYRDGARVSSEFIPDEFGDGKGLEVSTGDGRLTVKGEATLGRDAVIDLVRKVEAARQAVA